MTILQLLQGKTPQERVRICFRVLERLRLRHNEMGERFRNGEITEEQWKAFLSVWEAKHQRVYQFVNVIKENLNLFIEANRDTAITLKEDGKILTTYDQDIDIDNLE